MDRKHALIITAYQEIDYLVELCKVYTRYFYCYIHIDKKSKIAHEDIENLSRMQKVYVISKYKINWGSYKHILAISELLKKAVDDKMDYYHIISANTILIKPPKKLFDFFDENPNRIYMEIKERKPELFYEFDYRYTAYFFQHIYNLKGKLRFLWQHVEKYGSKLQRKMNIRKDIQFNYKGYIYCHLPYLAVDYVLEYIKKNPEYIQRLKYCYVSEEFFFQNILKDSPYGKDIVNDALIYDDWEDRGTGMPCFLDETDIIKIENSSCFFARKVAKKQRGVFDAIRWKENF